MRIKQIAGWKAQKDGKIWEAQFKFFMERAGFSVLKIPDGCKRIYFGGRIQLRAVKTPFDWVCASVHGNLFCDTKSIDSDRIVYSLIEPHQLKALVSLGRHGNKAGYICYLRKTGKVYFFNWDRLILCNARDSISFKEGICLGPPEKLEPHLIF
jgi:hypothetical protein